MGTFLRFRPKPRRYARELIATNIDTTYLQPTLAVLFGKRGSTQLASAMFADTSKAVNNPALANNASLVVWTPAGGNVIELIQLSLISSVAGSFSVQVNGVSVYQVQLLVNANFILSFSWPGWFLYPIASTLGVVNQTGGAVNLTLTAVGTEVPG